MYEGAIPESILNGLKYGKNGTSHQLVRILVTEDGIETGKVLSISSLAKQVGIPYYNNVRNCLRTLVNHGLLKDLGARDAFKASGDLLDLIAQVRGIEVQHEEITEPYKVMYVGPLSKELTRALGQDRVGKYSEFVRMMALMPFISSKWGVELDEHALGKLTKRLPNDIRTQIDTLVNKGLLIPFRAYSSKPYSTEVVTRYKPAGSFLSFIEKIYCVK
jgi:hypothetical protein